MSISAEVNDLFQNKGMAHGPGGVRSEWVLLTPELAEEFLAHNIDNRHVRKVHVTRLAHDMTKGHFAVTHQGIAFDDEGIMRDGQHRCLGVIASGVPVPVLVTYNLPATSQRFMDRGATRKVSDFMDGPHAAVRASAVRNLLAVRIAEGELTPGRLDAAFRAVTDGDVYDLLESSPGLVEDLMDLVPASRRASNQVPIGPSPLLAAAVLYPYIGETVLDGLATGENLEPGSPILAFRNYRLRIPPGGQSLPLYTACRVFAAVQSDTKLRKFPVVGVSGVVKVAPR